MDNVDARVSNIHENIEDRANWIWVQEKWTKHYQWRSAQAKRLAVITSICLGSLTRKQPTQTYTEYTQRKTRPSISNQLQMPAKTYQTDIVRQSALDSLPKTEILPRRRNTGLSNITNDKRTVNRQSTAKAVANIYAWHQTWNFP